MAKNRFGRVVLASSFVLLGVACSSTSTVTLEPCNAGEKVACELNGCSGMETCNADGRGYGECVCNSGGSGGSGAQGGGPSGGSSGAAQGGSAGSAGRSSGGSPGTVVTTLDQTGAPKGAVAVVVHDPDGHVVSTTQTGANGSVSVVVPDGGAVTVADGSLTTFLDISGADSIVATVGPDPLSTAPTFGAGTQLTLNLSSTLGVSSYDVAAPTCIGFFQSQTTASATYDLSSCASGPLDIYVIGYDSSGFPLAFGTLFNVLPTAGTTDTESVAVATSTFSNITGTIGLLPSGTTSVGELLKLRRGNRVAGSFSDSQTPTGNTANYSIRFPSVAVDGFRLQQDVSWPGHTAGHDLRAPSLSASQGTWDPLALAPVDVTAAITFPQPGRPNATWSLGAGQPGDAIAVDMMWAPSSGDASQWTFVMPSSATQMTAPELPASLSGYSIGSGATITYYEVTNLDMPSTNGYLAYLRAPTKPGFLGYFPFNTTQNCEVVRSSGMLP